MTKVPELESHCNSWVIVHASKEKALRETWNRSVAQEALDAGWRVFTAAQWLARFNSQVAA